MLAPDDPILVDIRHGIQVLSIFSTLCQQEDWEDALARLDTLRSRLANVEVAIQARVAAGPLGGIPGA